jgi:hypothetical protein
MKQNSFALLFVGILTMSALTDASDSMDLSGTWRVALDREDVGQDQGWYGKALPGEALIHLPGSLQERGYGDVPGLDTPWVGGIRYEEWDKPQYAPYRQVDNFKMPFWLQPDRYYKGAAWYQKTVTIPDTWQGRHITLNLERPHWQTMVWVDGRKMSTADSLSVPHVHDLSETLMPGRHVITLRVDNRMVQDVGVNSHSVSDHTQSNWNGIVGDITLRAAPAVWTEDVQVYPDLKTGRVRIRLVMGNRTGKSQSGTQRLTIAYDGQTVMSTKNNLTLGPGVHPVNLPPISLGKSIKIWDEFHPRLYTVQVEQITESGRDIRDTSFGMREVTTEGTQIVLNGHPIFLRGTLECCIFPRTGYPPTDVAEWERIIRVCKAHGLNHMRFHSWCPPEAAFTAADRLGFYLQVECSSWANQGSTIGDGKPIDDWLYAEADRILKAYGNHPSFLLLAYGNEPSGPERGAAYLRQWVPHCQKRDPRHLVTSGAGWPLIPESDFHVDPAPRIQAWGQQLGSRINSKPPETCTDYRDYIKRYPEQPIVSHEIGQWCVYPNFDEMKKYTGILKAKNFEVFQDFLKQKHMADLAHSFLMASGKLQTLCYKEDIESALRTDGFGGFQLLDLHDFPGQGTALVGVLDPFWNSKPYVTPAKYRAFSGPIVPLVRLKQRTFTTSQTLEAGIEISHFGPQDLRDVTVLCILRHADGRALYRARIWRDGITAGALHEIDTIHVPLTDLPAPARYNLEVTVENTETRNDWDIWVYPNSLDTHVPDDILLATACNDEVLARLRAGGKVLLVADAQRVRTDVTLGFSSIFWNTAWTGGQAPHTLGILCDPEHPALDAFPTEYHSNWQWWEPIQGAATLEMDHLPPGLRPIIQVVPDWFAPKRLGLVFEARVGRGSLMVCSVDILGDLDKRPVVRQLRHSLIRYMQSKAFAPDHRVDSEAIQGLMRPPSPMEQLNARVIHVDSFESNYEGALVLDGNPKTMWHTDWSKGKSGYPHEIQIDLKDSITFAGITCLPRQDGNPNGRIAAYAVYVSDNLMDWGAAVAEGTLLGDVSPQRIPFDKTAKGRYLRLVAGKGFNNDVFTSLAELDLIGLQSVNHQ